MSASRSNWILLTAPLLILFTVTPLQAAEWLPVTPEDLQLKSEPKAPGATAIYLYREVNRDDTASDEYQYERLKILTEEGRKYADVEIVYDKSSESIRSIDARTIRPDGSIVKFDGTVYDKVIASGRGAKVMAKTFTMPEAGVGSIIEYRYRRIQDERYVFDSHWILSQELFTKRAKFSLIPSEYFSMRWSWPRGLPDGTPPPVKDRGRIKLEAHDVPAFATEELMPPENELKYRIDFIYVDDGSIDDKPDAYWKRVGKKDWKVVEKFIDRRKVMERAVAEIVAPGDSPETKLRKIYARLERIHNESYEPEKTDEEIKRAKKEESHNVEDVWTRSSGNASQLNYLFIALARAAGLEANSVALATRDRYFFDPKMMNARQLNSHVVLVTIAGKDWFLDPGVPFTPFGALPWYETALHALRLDSNGGTWVTTPIPLPADARIERQARLKLEERGTLAGTLTVRYGGLEGAWRRLAELNEDDAERKRYMEDQIRNSVASGIEVKLTNTPDWSAWDEPLVAEFEFRVPGWVASAGQRSLLRVGLFGGEEAHTFEHQIRTQPIYFNFPYQYSDDVFIEIPSGKHVGNLTKPHNLHYTNYSYDLVTEEQSGTLHLKRDISIGLLVVNVRYYDQLRQFFQSVRNADEEQVVIAPVVAQR